MGFDVPARPPAVGRDLAALVAEALRARNHVSRAFFAREADRLAETCAAMAERFLRGGRLLSFGRGACATDAQHVTVEFVHPVLVGKRALPALDLSAAFPDAVPLLAGESDIVMGFSPFGGDPLVEQVLEQARSNGALTLALPGRSGERDIQLPTPDPFIAQEMIEILYHTLWETVHVFFEHRERGHDDVGASSFLYPYLGSTRQDTSTLVGDVAGSIRAKAAEDERLREELASTRAGAVADAIEAVAARTRGGATLLIFGNGGSATDANDWAIDCVCGGGGRRIRAMSLSAEPATLTALANDIGADSLFMRQIAAYGREGDVAIAISTSGGSANVIAALEEARRHGMLTLALLGYDGGQIARRHLADLSLVVNCDHIPRIQEVQASIYHVMTEAWLQWSA